MNCEHYTSSRKRKFQFGVVQKENFNLELSNKKNTYEKNVRILQIFETNINNYKYNTCTIPSNKFPSLSYRGRNTAKFINFEMTLQVVK